ncbi:MAG TPA: cytochrome P450 [Ktedonobacterales bacterium]
MTSASTEVMIDASGPDATGGRCPVDQAPLHQRKTARDEEPVDPPIARDANGVWQVRGFAAVRAVMRSGDTRQAGFKAELLERLPATALPNRPILYQEGKVHQEQRRQTARYFAPKVVSERYRDVIEAVAAELVARLRRARHADLSRMSQYLAVRVAGAVVGLTNSRLPGQDRRLDAFFAEDAGTFGWSPRALWRFARMQAAIAAFYALDVRPAIRARRRHPQEDVISHLIAQGYSDAEILTECVTFAAAGMVTTREFICAAAWHLLEQPDLRARYLAGTEEERYALLHEVLRLEPVVGHLLRRATAEMRIESGGDTIVVPRGDLLDLHIYAANADPAVVGGDALAIRPGRTLCPENAHAAVMGFGDGHHRCPGASIAIQESDLFLRRLLALEGLRIARSPSLGWNTLVTGYELRDFLVTLD